MNNTSNTQPHCPCASGSVNFSREGDAYCPDCEHSYGPWTRDGDGFATPVVPIDYDDLSLSEPDYGDEDAAMEYGLFGDC